MMIEMTKNLSGFKPGESIMGSPVGQANEGNGIYAPMQQHHYLLEEKLNKIHKQLAEKGIHPVRFELGKKPVSLKPYSWDSKK